MAKLKLLVVLSVFSLLFLSGICPGWAAIYGVVTEPAYTNPNSPAPAEIPLKFNTTKGLQNFDLKATFDPAKLEYQGYIGGDPNQYDASGLYRVEVHQPADDPDEIRISGMVENVVTLPSAVTQGLYQLKFLTLKFQAKSGTAGENPTVDITGVTDSGNPLSAIPSTQSVVGITEQSYQVNVCVDPVPSQYEVKLWGVSATGQAVDQRKAVSNGVADTVIEVPAGTYYVMAQSRGYKVDKVARVDTDDLKPVSFTFTQLKRRVTMVRRIVTNNMLELNFAYVENDGIGIDGKGLIDWDPNVPLALNFYGSGDISDPNGPSIVFDPNIGDVIVGSASPAGLVTNQEVFGKHYISITIDPNAYCKGETPTSYTVAFRVSTTNGEFDPFDVAFQVDKLSTIKMTEKSMGQATSAFKAVEVASVGGIPVRADFYLDEVRKKTMESTITVNNIDTNYFKVGTVGALYINPNTLADLGVNLEVEFEPKVGDPDSTVVHIRFTDATGLPMEYDPPAEVRATAGAIEFDIPLHKDLQNKFRYDQYMSDHADDLWEIDTDDGDPWDGDLNSYYSDLNILDEVLGCLITDQSQAGTKDLYGIFYQGINDLNPVLFTPQVQYGESVGVWADPDSELFYAHVVTKHASDWFTQEVTAVPIPVSTRSADDDEWYECFIELISPRFSGITLKPIFEGRR